MAAGRPNEVFLPLARTIKALIMRSEPLGSRRLPIFPGRLQPSIVGVCELNFCVRNGNRWDLTA